MVGDWICEYGKPDMAVGVAHVSTAKGMYGDIATVWSVYGEAEKMGNLIAAAPDLLEALKALVAEADPSDVRLSSPVYEAQKAIAKAEGKTNDHN